MCLGAHDTRASLESRRCMKAFENSQLLCPENKFGEYKTNLLIKTLDKKISLYNKRRIVQVLSCIRKVRDIKREIGLIKVQNIYRRYTLVTLP